MRKKSFYITGLGIGFCAILFMLCGFRIAHADGLVVSPAVIDGSGVPNDILNYTLTVTNTAGTMQNVFASVYDLTPSGTQPVTDPSGPNRNESLSAWISVSRAATQLAPGETRQFPLSVQIDPYAIAGDYHAVVAFVVGGTRPDAEQHLAGAPQTLVNLAVASNLVASLKVDSFAANKAFYSSFPASFTYTLENTGDLAVAPVGQIVFYDKDGHQLDAIDANPDSIVIQPKEKKSFMFDWAHNGGFGQYKAVLSLTYGNKDDRLENTALVWVLPWKKLLIIFTSLFIVIIVLALWLHHEYEKRYHRRRRAIENLIKKHSRPAPTLDLRHPHE
jgi:hypothetical protein